MKADNNLDRNTAGRWEFAVFGRYTHGPKAGSINRKSIVTISILADDQKQAVARLTDMCSDHDDKGNVIPGTGPAYQITRRLLSQAEQDAAKARVQAERETSSLVREAHESTEEELA